MKRHLPIWILIATVLVLALSNVGCGGIGTDVGNPEKYLGTYANPSSESTVSPSADPDAGDDVASEDTFSAFGDDGAPAPTFDPASPSPSDSPSLPDCNDRTEAEKTITIDPTNERNGVLLSGFFAYTGLVDPIKAFVTEAGLSFGIETESSITLACNATLTEETLLFTCEVTINGETSSCELEIAKQ